jgi:dolichol-phosphate mannosyltransferase
MSNPTSPPVQGANVIVALPAYNEEENIGPLLQDIKQAMSEAGLCYSVIVVDDGSRDCTAQVLRESAPLLPLTVHRHEVNQGLGVTIRDALLLAVKQAGDGDAIVTMDADGTHAPSLVPAMVRLIEEGHDVVIASRYQPGARVFGLSLLRTLLSQGASWMFRILFPIRGVRDYTCGFRAYRAGALKRAISIYGDTFVTAQGFHCMLEILLNLRELGLTFTEVPMILRYDLKHGATKMKIPRTVRQTLVLAAKRWFGTKRRPG